MWNLLQNFYKKIFLEKELSFKTNIYDFAPVGVVLLNSEGEILYGNHFFFSLILEHHNSNLTYKSEKKINFFNFISIDDIDHEHPMEEWRQFYSSANLNFMKKYYLIKSDQTLAEVACFFSRFVPEKNLKKFLFQKPDSDEQLIFTILMDLTETKNLLMKNQFFMGLLDNSDAIAIVRPNGEIIDANDLFCLAVKSEKDFLISQSYDSLFQGQNGFPPAIFQIDHDQIYRDEISKSGQYQTLWFDRTFIPYFISGKLEYFYILHMDITQRVEQEFEISKSNEILNLISYSQSEFISTSNPLVFNDLLERVAHLKQAKLGIVFEVKHDIDAEVRRYLKMIAFHFDENSHDSKWFLNFGKKLEIENLENLIGNPVLTGDVVLSNAPLNDPRSHGVPVGHPKIKNLLAIPIKKGLSVVGVLALANSEKDFTWKDVEDLSPIQTALSSMISAKEEHENREKIEKENRILEQRLTGQLKQLDEILTLSPETYLMFSSHGQLEFVSNATRLPSSVAEFFKVGLTIRELDIIQHDLVKCILDLIECAKIGLKESKEIVLHGSEAERNNEKYFKLTSLAIHNDHNEIVSVICIIKNITELKKIEKDISVARDLALKSSENKTEYLSALYDQMTPAIQSLKSIVSLFEREQSKIINDAHGAQTQNLDLNADFQKKFSKIMSKSIADLESMVNNFFNVSVNPIDIEKKFEDVDYDLSFNDRTNKLLKPYQLFFKDKKITVDITSDPHFAFNSKKDDEHCFQVLESLINVFPIIMHDVSIKIHVCNLVHKNNFWGIHLEIFGDDSKDNIITLFEDFQSILNSEDVLILMKYKNSFEDLKLKMDAFELRSESISIDLQFDFSKNIFLKKEFHMMNKKSVEPNNLIGQKSDSSRRKEQVDDSGAKFNHFKKKLYVFEHRSDVWNFLVQTLPLLGFEVHRIKLFEDVFTYLASHFDPVFTSRSKAFLNYEDQTLEHKKNDDQLDLHESKDLQDADYPLFLIDLTSVPSYYLEQIYSIQNQLKGHIIFSHNLGQTTLVEKLLAKKYHKFIPRPISRENLQRLFLQ